MFGPDTPAGQHPLLARVQRLHGHARRRHQCDFDELEREIAALEVEVRALIAVSTGQPHQRPATITVTASQKGQTMSSYVAGTAVDLVADVKNDQQADITDTVTWSTDQGTITTNPADPTNPLKAQLVGAPVGTVTVTATTSNGLPATDAIEFTDPNATVPASISITDSAAPTAA